MIYILVYGYKVVHLQRTINCLVLAISSRDLTETSQEFFMYAKTCVRF